MSQETTTTQGSPAKGRKRRWLLKCAGVVGLFFAAWLAYMHRPRTEMMEQLAALRVQGYGTSLAELTAKVKSVPDSQNLSLAVMDTVSLLDGSQKLARDGVEAQVRGEPTSAEGMAVLRSFVTNNAEAFERGAEILKRTEGSVNLDYSKGFELLLPHLSKFKELASAYSTKMRVAAEGHRAHEATVDALTIFQIARALEDEPLLISHLVRYAVVAIGCQGLDRALNLVEFPAADLVELQNALGRLESLTRMDLALSGELCTGSDAFGGRPNVLLMASLSENQPPNPALRAGIHLYTALGFLKSERANHVRMLADLIRIARLPSWEQRAPLLVWEKEVQRMRSKPRPGSLLSPMLLPALVNAGQKEWTYLANVRCTAVGVAIERYRLDHDKKAPETLEALVPKYLKAVPLDPFDGKPLRFRREDRSWTVYSIGPNGRDDFGYERVKEQRGDNYDIVFVMER